MTKLVALSFAANELDGSLPTDICTNLPFLLFFDLTKNYLSGPIPTNLSRCSKLEALSLSYNFFSGKIPAEIGYLTSLQLLFLGGNNFKGMLPQEIGNLRRLTNFAVEVNQIEGSVDFDIFMNMSSLQQVSLWSNKFSGSLSSDVGNLTMLTSFELGDNYFTDISRNQLKNWVENSAPDEVIDANLLANLQGEQFDKILQCVSSILELALKCSTESAGDRMNMKETHAELQKIKRRFFPVRSRNINRFQR